MKLVSFKEWTLNGNEYCISRTFIADNDDIFTIFKMMKALKQIIYAELEVK